MKFPARFATIVSVVVIGVLLLMFSASLYGALCITLGTLVLYLVAVPMFTGKPSPSLTGIDDINKITDVKKYNLCMLIWGITYS